ncbi:hypothetical protein BJY04DRAFT_196359 [Aspergillus karnatakaensis]|uniref:uncharacterized protein n=1 Tax=Aspergillus karnatakaensis TaxID=1810916 RepID=UPI003CCD620B
MDLRLDALPNSPEFTAEDLHAALLPHRDTLEHVHLEYARDPDAVSHPAAYADYCNSRAKIPSFEGFPNLETIFLQHAILPPHPRFSPAVQRLDITDCNSSIREMITHIANDVKANLYPKLTEIKVLAFDITKPIKLPGQIVPRGQTPEQCFLSLQNVFKGTKVDFQIYPYEMPDLEGGPFYGDDNDNPEDADPRQGPFHPPVTREQLLGQLMRMAAQDPELAALVRQDDSDESWDMDEE